ncbi:MAG: adenosylcobinamide-GDP ribazoletransferase, partial [Acidimicrobiales bacterium]
MSEPGGSGPGSSSGEPGGRSLLGAFSFLTCLGGGRPPSQRATLWFPLVGLALGLALGGIWWGAHRAWPVGVAAVLVVVADLVLTGMLHFDGLLDAADGLLAPMDRARRLEVMADPRTGAFGVTAGAATLLVRWVTLAAMAPRPLLL